MKNKHLKIMLAAPRGFCAGVDRAIEIVKKSIESFWAMFGSLFFLITCIIFLIPFFRKEVNEK